MENDLLFQGRLVQSELLYYLNEYDDNQDHFIHAIFLVIQMSTSGNWARKMVLS